jgi:hypothetical protein
MYAQKKHLITSTANCEVVHFNSSGSNVASVFNVGRVPLAQKDSCKYLGIIFYRHMSMIESSKHAAGPFIGICFLDLSVCT